MLLLDQFFYLSYEKFFKRILLLVDVYWKTSAFTRVTHFWVFRGDFLILGLQLTVGTLHTFLPQPTYALPLTRLSRFATRMSVIDT